MKRLILVFCLLASTAVAQGPPPGGRPGGQPAFSASPALPENYVLTLSVNNEGQVATELSLLVATSDFSSSFPDAKPAVNTLNGTITLEEDGSIIIRYILNVEVPINRYDSNPQTRSSSTQSSVRLHLDTPVQILKAGTRIYQLSIRKASTPAPEGP